MSEVRRWLAPGWEAMQARQVVSAEDYDRLVERNIELHSEVERLAQARCDAHVMHVGSVFGLALRVHGHAPIDDATRKLVKDYFDVLLYQHNLARAETGPGAPVFWRPRVFQELEVEKNAHEHTRQSLNDERKRHARTKRMLGNLRRKVFDMGSAMKSWINE